MMKKLCLVLVKYYLELPALVKYCIEPIQINPNSQNSNDNKPVLKIPLVLTLSETKCFFYESKIVKKLGYFCFSAPGP